MGEPQGISQYLGLVTVELLPPEVLKKKGEETVRQPARRESKEKTQALGPSRGEAQSAWQGLPRRSQVNTPRPQPPVSDLLQLALVG